MILLQSLVHFILLLFLPDKNITTQGKEKVLLCDGRQRCDNKFTLEVWGRFHGPVDHRHGLFQRRDKEYDRVRRKTGRDLGSCLRSAKEPGVSGDTIMKIITKPCPCIC